MGFSLKCSRYQIERYQPMDQEQLILSDIDLKISNWMQVSWDNFGFSLNRPESFWRAAASVTWLNLHQKIRRAAPIEMLVPPAAATAVAAGHCRQRRRRSAAAHHHGGRDDQDDEDDGGGDAEDDAEERILAVGGVDSIVASLAIVPVQALVRFTLKCLCRKIKGTVQRDGSGRN
jgi:hypothetical protein